MTASLGASPSPIPVALPRLPRAEALLPYLRRIDDGRRYTNQGPLVDALEDRLAQRYAAPDGVVTVANATLGLTAALIAAGVRQGGRCLMPSWTFAATAHAARLAGLVPHFLDIDPATGALSVGVVEAACAARHDPPVAAAIVVAPFGAPLDPDPWDALTLRTGVPVVIDAAAGFDTLRAGRSPAVVSLHATKIVAAAEGGFVVSTDAARVRDIRRSANFGFRGTRAAQSPGLNAKLSEYHAAIALAALDGWVATRAAFAARALAYREALGGQAAVGFAPGFGTAWQTATCVVEVPDATKAAAALGAAGIDSRRWWGEGCHRQPAFAECPRGPLPGTERLAARAIGLPMYEDLALAEVNRIAGVLSAALDPPARAALLGA